MNFDIPKRKTVANLLDENNHIIHYQELHLVLVAHLVNINL